MRLELQQVSAGYGNADVLRSVTFDLASGVIGCLLGPSGCGKTTLLRCVAGFEPVRSGQIIADAAVLSGPGFTVAPELRSFGLVFQDHALFPHLTVLQNVSFGLHRLPANRRAQRAAEVLEAVGLDASADAYPHEISGGQQQRVALARAVAPRPRLLMLDEPFSSLDADLRLRLSGELRGFLKASGTTALMVTHDQKEAFAIADEIGVLRDGVLEQWDSAFNLYHEPATRFVADFVGRGTFVQGVVLSGNEVEIEIGIVRGSLTRAYAPGSKVDVLLRPDDIQHDDSSALTATVSHKAFRGADILYTLSLPSGIRVFSLVPSHHNHDVGSKIGIRLAADHIVAFDREPASQAR